MFKQIAPLALAALIAAGVGCSKDRPHEYGQERPPVDQLDARDKGLQSKDVVAATDQLAQDLLSLPELNQSKTQWTIVVDRMENHTTDPAFNYDIFTERLRTNLSRYGHGRVALIENKSKYHEVRSRELENEREDAAQSPTGGAGTQPDYALYGKVYEIANRGTSYYMAEFNLTNLQNRQMVWSKPYEVKVAR
jgi:hypothetical protein